LGITVLPLEEQPISPDADVTGQLQNLLLSEANVIYMQNLSFGGTQVIGTLHALGAWEQVILGSVNWAMNQDTVNFLGENAALAEGWYGVYPNLGWNDTDVEGVQKATHAFETGGHPESEKTNTYLLAYGSIYALRDIVEHAINRDGFENLSGETFFDAMKDMGTIDAFGLFELDVRDGNRAPAQAQIRQAQMVDGQIEFVQIEDFFELPDTRPSGE
jgi:branched-chain amino acid transport system substrate-binding protein